MRKKKKEPAIIIDGVEHKLKDLTDEQRGYVDHIADLDRKLQSMQFNLEQLAFGKQAFANKLNAILNQSEEK